ncbi:MAG: CPBP family intramembrane glutamic endopeptidase [Novosphingobium sp.]
MTEANAKGSVADALIGLALALGIFVVIFVVDMAGLYPHNSLLDRVFPWAIYALVLWWAISVEGLSWSSLGFRRPTLGTIGWGSLALAAILDLMAVYYRLVVPLFGGTAVPAAVDTITAMSMPAILLLSVTSGVVEELLFRFYPIDRLHWLTGNRWIASIIPLVVFTALHVPSFGLGQVIPVALAATVLTLLYWWRRDIRCNAFVHFMLDFSAFAAIALGVHRPG